MVIVFFYLLLVTMVIMVMLVMMMVVIGIIIGRVRDMLIILVMLGAFLMGMEVIYIGMII